ncbi:Molybdenum-pterin-binding protein MopA [Oligella urethralis]|uniref:TOBE domain-containing protein n=1 Tax=Oligella urethralis TaxID=90245 RepID=UPI002958D280|nr:TOBE domain-containing protein [Oligella urethralis]WOS37993.1 Molybdenum-pterin-binding protein MopA [Oligella urethralis]
MKTSARNQFEGTVKSITTGSVNDEVTLEIANGALITAIITKESTAHLGLAEGAKAFALVKASSVILATDLEGVKLSTRNQLNGTVTELNKGAVNAEVALEVALGMVITTIVTNQSVDNLGLAPGVKATAIIKASHVIVGTKA